MCILIHQPKNACFTSVQLEDFFQKNPDGFGAIVKNGSTVEVIKSVGNLSEIEDLYYNQVACHEAVIHFRMKTHGEIDIANCHPYEVIPGIWMAHNGILATGNAKDPKMSDTYHYIQDYLKPLLSKNPELMTDPAFLALVGGHIGNSNKFAFMNEKGEVGIVNKAAGYTFWDLANKELEVWYSNTYAWNPYKLGFMSYPKPAPYSSTTYGSSKSWEMWDQYDRDERQGTLGLSQKKPIGKVTRGKKDQRKLLSKRPKSLKGESLKRVIRSSYNAISLDGYDGVLRWVEDHPMMAMNFLYQIYGNESIEGSTAQDISDQVNFDPEWAADDVYTAWADIEDDLLDLADIKQPTTQIAKGKYL